MNRYEITYQAPRSGVMGIVKEEVSAGSEQGARDLVRARFGSGKVQVIGGRMIEFGGGRDDRRDGKR